MAFIAKRDRPLSSETLHGPPSSNLELSADEVRTTEPSHSGETSPELPTSTSFEGHPDNDAFQFVTINHPKKLKDNTQMRLNRQYVMHNYLRRESQNKVRASRDARTVGYRTSQFDSSDSERPSMEHSTSVPKYSFEYDRLIESRPMEATEDAGADASMLEQTDALTSKPPQRSRSTSAGVNSRDGAGLPPSPTTKAEQVEVPEDQSDTAVDGAGLWSKALGGIEACLAYTVLRFARLLRAAPMQGCTRLEWTCTCGRRLYGDYNLRSGSGYTTFLGLLEAAPKRTKPSFALLLGQQRRRMLLQSLTIWVLQVLLLAILGLFPVLIYYADTFSASLVSIAGMLCEILAPGDDWVWWLFGDVWFGAVLITSIAALQAASSKSKSMVPGMFRPSMFPVCSNAQHWRRPHFRRSYEHLPEPERRHG